jgi:hypothetical protein
MANYHFRDKALSWKAKGILSTMLSLPDDWDYSLAGLATLSDDGMSATRAAIKELEKYGYLERKPIRNNGKFVDWEYSIYEKPQVEKPVVENPQVENPQEEKPQVENHTQLSTKESSTKKQNTKRSSTKGFVPPTLEEIQNYCKERNNNVDAKKFFDYFSASDWVDSKGNPVRNWKQKVITWEGYNNEKSKKYGRKEPIPGWMGFKAGEAERENIRRLMEEPITAGNDPDLAERAEKLRQSLGG